MSLLAKKASKDTFGHVKIGNGINVTDEVISVAEMTADNVEMDDGKSVQEAFDSLKSDTDNKVLAVRDAVVSKGGTVTQAGEVPTGAELVSGVEGIPVNNSNSNYISGISHKTKHYFQINSNTIIIRDWQGNLVYSSLILATVSGSIYQRIIFLCEDVALIMIRKEYLSFLKWDGASWRISQIITSPVEIYRVMFDYMYNLMKGQG